MQKRLPTWLVLIFGIVLGSTLTSTLTFHLWWCEQRTLTLVHSRASVPVAVTGTRASERCVCEGGLEAEGPDSAADMSPPHVLLEGKQAGHAPVSLKEVTNDALQQKEEGSHLKAANELGSKVTAVRGGNSPKVEGEGLLVAVVAVQGRLEWVESVYDTWGQDINQLVIFAGDSFNASYSRTRGLPLVQLKGVGLPSKMLMAVVQYLTKHHISSHKWFLLAVDNSYVRADRLQELLTQLDPSQQVYMGRSAAGRPGEAGQLGLKSHERYCLGSSGIVLSSALLLGLRGELEKCSDGGVPGDVALGKCVSRVLDLQCNETNQSRSYFFEDYSGQPLTADYISNREIFSSLINYHPVPSLGAMATLHQYYKHLEFTSLLDRLKSVQRQLVDVCGSITPISTVSENCVPSLVSEKQTDNSGAVGSLSAPYLPTTIYDFQPWVYFDSTTIFPDQNNYPSYKMKLRKNTRQELKQVLTKAVQRSSEQNGRALKFKKLVNGWMRHNPFIGNEYIFDILLVDGARKVVSRRINLVRPLGSNLITRKDSMVTETPINMIVPLTNVNQRFKEFMSMYEKLALTSSERVRLVLSVYGEEDIRLVRSVVEEYHRKYPSAQMTVVEGSGKFSRGRALHGAVAHLAPKELIFFCDVDMKIRSEFLERCRRNTIQGKRVYYPEFFKLYNMDYVYWNMPRPKYVSLKRSHGHWAYYSFGMLCMYKSDYSTVGGMDTKIDGWGDEDVQFFNKVLKSRLDVLRAPDTSLSHRWHDKFCSKGLSPEQYKHCLSSQQENLADRKELAHYIQARGMTLKGTGGVVDLASNATVEEEEEEDYGYG